MLKLKQGIVSSNGKPVTPLVGVEPFGASIIVLSSINVLCMKPTVAHAHFYGHLAPEWTAVGEQLFGVSAPSPPHSLGTPLGVYVSRNAITQSKVEAQRKAIRLFPLQMTFIWQLQYYLSALMDTEWLVEYVWQTPFARHERIFTSL